jgi:sigma-E factor negative regulatory protein RseA
MKPSAASDMPPAEERRALMSALADGEAEAVPAACALWRDDADARATWHAYHLIGDVLRSDDLAAPSARDADFLSALRTRLAQEPTVLAPAVAAAVASPSPTSAQRPIWLLPLAAAAGFVVVTGVMVLARTSAPAADAPVVAVGGRGNPALQLTSNGVAPAGALVIPGQLIRDARLEAYFRAHRGAFGGTPAAMPGGVPRNIETLAPVDPVPGAR